MSESIKIGGRDITVHQLKMSDIRRFIAALQKDSEDKDREAHVMDMLFDDDVPAKAVAVATGLSMEELAGDFSQDEMRLLLDTVKATNPFFVGMMERLVEAGRQLNKA